VAKARTKAVVFERFGNPEELLHICDVPRQREPGPGQMRVRMHTSPVNLSDLLYARGSFDEQSTLTATPAYS
jgi:NADPH:quinone reductase-like Zn-dependent oxidoreductase